MTEPKRQTSNTRARKNGTLALALTGVVGAMIGLAFASVPLYQLFCKVTGYGGTPGIEQAREAAPDARTIKVRFDANVNGDLPWQFKPMQTEVTVKVGETVLAHYRAVNTSEQAVVGTSTFNVTPHKAGPYFNKVECFCFTEQRLEPGQEVFMPVSFFVDPEIFEESNTREVRAITLSYTFYRVKTDPAETASTRTADPARQGAKL